MRTLCQNNFDIKRIKNNAGIIGQNPSRLHYKTNLSSLKYKDLTLKLFRILTVEGKNATAKSSPL